jgi:hypothetical protein
MMPLECPFESDLIDAIRSSRWPARAEATLVAHVDACPLCRDVAAVAPAILGAGESDAVAAMAAPAIPDARVVWLRAQWRARAEAERRATHPITAAQAAALAAAAALGGAIFGATSGWLQGGLATMASAVVAALPTASAMNAVATTFAAHAAMATSAVLVILAAPVVAYVATRE